MPATRVVRNGCTRQLDNLTGAMKILDSLSHYTIWHHLGACKITTAAASFQHWLSRMNPCCQEKVTTSFCVWSLRFWPIWFFTIIFSRARTPHKTLPYWNRSTHQTTPDPQTPHGERHWMLPPKPSLCTNVGNFVLEISWKIISQGLLPVSSSSSFPENSIMTSPPKETWIFRNGQLKAKGVGGATSGFPTRRKTCLKLLKLRVCEDTCGL